ncbi:MAG TPA: response regulator [Acidimicrobiales bacterium]|nr:response regulator [Acidimicrobiales bacterium]
MPQVIVCADTSQMREEIKAGLSMLDCEFRDMSNGFEVMAGIGEEEPDLVVLDMQTGKMGGMATCMEMRLEESGGRCGHIPVLLLVDRRPDVFLARRAQADGFLVKPLNPVRLRRAATSLLKGGAYQDDSYLPSAL